MNRIDLVKPAEDGPSGQDAPPGARGQPPFHPGMGFWTLYRKEVMRFVKVYSQTLLAPIVTTLLFLAIFALVIGGQRGDVYGVPFMTFLAPGLVMMAMLQNAFTNTSSSIIISKIQGNIVDVLMPPLSTTELIAAYTLGGVTRGVAVGFVTTISVAFVVDLSIHSTAAILYHGVMASLALSLLGLLTGIWADKFDHLASVTNFVIMPLSFLSGTFYSLERLPQAIQDIAHINPFFYMIDGFRYGFIGVSDSSPVLGGAVTGGFALFLAALCYGLFRAGYKLKD